MQERRRGSSPISTPAIARAVRETWPGALLYHSRHHLAGLLRARALADGVPERIRLTEPVALARPLPWTGSPTKRWGEHPLYAAMLTAQRGPAEWAACNALVEEYVPPERLALRSWIATNELLIERQWRLAAARRGVPLSRGALEGKIGEWLAPIARRAGRWQNRRRLDLVLRLMTLHGRGEAHAARYAKLVRAQFTARGNRSHTADENELPTETYQGTIRQMSWWRTFQDRWEASLPALVRAAARRTRRRAADDHAERVRERLAERYAAEIDRRTRLDLPVPPRGRPRRPTEPAGSVMGRVLADYEDLLLEWDWSFNGGLDPATLPAGSHERVAWRCLLEPAHTWETRVADRTSRASCCPYHMAVLGSIQPNRSPPTIPGSPPSGTPSATACGPTRSRRRRPGGSSGVARRATNGRPRSTSARSRSRAAPSAIGSRRQRAPGQGRLALGRHAHPRLSARGPSSWCSRMLRPPTTRLPEPVPRMK